MAQSIIIPDGAVHPDNIKELIEEIMALDPIDSPSISTAIRDLDDDELEILSAVITLFKRKIHHYRSTRKKGMSNAARRNHAMHVDNMLARKGKVFNY